MGAGMGCVQPQPLNGMEVTNVAVGTDGFVMPAVPDLQKCHKVATPVPRDSDEVEFHDNYMLGVKLGRGAFGQVRAAIKRGPQPFQHNEQEEERRQEVAVKIVNLRDSVGLECVRLLKTANQEAALGRAIGEHPNCVAMYDAFFGKNFCYMVMEKCSTGLYQAMESMPDLTERGLGNIVAQMLLGVAHSHSVGVVHRDIKPDNFLVGGQHGELVKLADFGLSAMLPRSGRMSGVYGTAPFMSPEMLNGDGYNEKADVWSLGVIVYTFMFGTFPYVPKEASSKHMKMAIRAGNTPSFRPVPKGGQYRSDPALKLVRALLNRDSSMRLSASEALQTQWMYVSMNGQYMPDEDLPSLRPMLFQAKKVGAFEIRDPANVTADDVLLNQMQMQRRRCSDQMQPRKVKEPEQKKDNWENTSNLSTSCASSNGHGSQQGSQSTGHRSGQAWNNSSLHSDTSSQQPPL